MKKILYSFLTFVGIGIIVGVVYVLFTDKNDESSLVNNNNNNLTPSVQSGTIQSGTVAPSLPVEMSGGEALDPYRHNSISGSKSLYKGVEIMPVVEINLDCSTANTPQNRQDCEKFKANIERTEKNRENNTGNLVPESTGTTSLETTASGSQI